MKASLDTNAIIHFYRANLQNILFEFFNDGVIIYEQIRTIELENQGGDLLSIIDSDIEAGKIEIYTNQKLKDLATNYNIKIKDKLISLNNLLKI